MKKSDENTKKEISSIIPSPQETSQTISAKTITSAEETIPANTGNNFFGIFRRLVCSPNANLSDDSEIVSIPKTQSK